MGWCRRSSRLICDAFRCYNPKIVLQPRNPIIQQSVSTRFFSSIIPNSSKIYKSPSPWKNPYRHLTNRSYYRSSYDEFKLPSVVSIVVFTGVGLWILGPNVEDVPYTKRPQFVLLSNSHEKILGKIQFWDLKTEYEGKILPPLDPDNIRAQRIANDIIDGLKKGLEKEQIEEKQGKEKQGKEKQGMEKQGKEKQGMKSHVEGLNWEIIVVNDTMIRACCFPGGKIVVSTGLLNHFTEDAEVAAIIGHEVGHAVGRHTAEEISQALWTCYFYGWLLITTSMTVTLIAYFMPTFFEELPLSLRLDMEADHIGVMLMASAGYDPRVTPQVYEKFGEVVGDSVLKDYKSIKKRIESLEEAKMMEKALNIYREVQAEREDKAFP